MMTMNRIDFLIVGAAKSATTWLQRALQADPAVRMPDPELHYFSRESGRGDHWYLAAFPDPAGAAAVGEKSNSYMQSPEAAARIRAALPRIRIVAQLRDPVERAYSDYCMLYRRGEVDGDVRRHLDPRWAAQERCLVGGLYLRQLLPFYEAYGSDRVLVTLYEKMKAAPPVTLGHVRVFLGLPRETGIAPPSSRTKDRQAKMVPRGVSRALTGVKPLVGPLRGNPVFERARSLIAREVRYPPLPADLRARLAEHYAPENERLGSLLGLDLAPWAGSAEARAPL